MHERYVEGYYAERQCISAHVEKLQSVTNSVDDNSSTHRDMMTHLPDVQDVEADAAAALRETLLGGSPSALSLIKQ